MNKYYKHFLIFSLLFIVVFSLKLYRENMQSKNLKNLSVEYEAKATANFLVAFRKTYQNIFIKNHIQLNENNIEFLPVKTTAEISKIFSTLNTQTKIMTVSTRPRDPKNMANKRQAEVIKYFMQHKDKKSLFKQIGDKYYYSQPLYITKTCLKCHGKREEAPLIIRKKYSKAYDYKLGDVRGIIDIELQQTDFSKIIEKGYKRRVYFVIGFLFFVIVIGFLYARYNTKVAQEMEKEKRIREEKEQQLLQQSRLAQMGEMISMIAHQWRQPLTAISASANTLSVDIMMDNYDKEFFEEQIKNIAKYSQHLSLTIDDFRNFFKNNKEKQIFKLEEVVDNTLSIIEVTLKSKNIQLIKDFQANKEIESYPNELKQVILNLIKNAEDILIEKEIKNPQIEIKTFVEDKNVVLTVEDNAGGVPENIIDKIFDPYFSTKLAKDGTGLGLYMSKTIIEEHCHGRLSVSNSEFGAVFKIELELYDE